jgi:hypothetical protein
MSLYFFDTSALVKQYHAEIGTPEVRRLLTEPGAERVISRIATVEMFSGFAGKVRTGAISAAGFTTLRGRFLADVKRRVVRPVRVIRRRLRPLCQRKLPPDRGPLVRGARHRQAEDEDRAALGLNL